MVCRKCGIEKEASEFWSKSKGTLKECNDCRKAYFREYARKRRVAGGAALREKEKVVASEIREAKKPRVVCGGCGRTLRSKASVGLCVWCLRALLLGPEVLRRLGAMAKEKEVSNAVS